MERNKNIKYNLARLNALKDATIVLNIDKMDVDNDLSLYDSLFHCFARGDLDNQFESYVFEDISEDERLNLIDTVKNYRGLCFYKNDPEFWLESLDGFYFSDPELTSYFIFENYDFMLNLAKNFGIKSLDFIEKLSNYNEFQNFSIIDTLRNNFENDDILLDTISKMNQNDSLFNLFTDEQKAMLLAYPCGNLYEYTEDGIKMKSVLDLAISIYSEFVGENFIDKFNISNIEDFIKLLNNFFNENDINDIIIKNYEDYLNDFSRYEKPDIVEHIEYDDSYQEFRKYFINLTKPVIEYSKKL